MTATDIEESRNPLVFLDITIGREKVGRIVLELFAEQFPKTAENFRCLCTGEKGMGKKGYPLHYKGSTFHRIITNFMVQGGDFTDHKGTGGESIYGEKFADEGFSVKHTSRGILSMANSGPDTNGSQFFITCTDTHHLDNKHVAFGKVVHGIGVVGVMEKIETDEEKPLQPVVIADCGELLPDAPLGIVDEDGTEDRLPQFPEDVDHELIDLWKAPVSDILDSLNQIKSSGNHHFKEKNYPEAVFKYRKCLCYMDYVTGLCSTAPPPPFSKELPDRPEPRNPPTPEEELQLNAVRVSCLLNRALCFNKTAKSDAAVADCDQVLSLEPNNAKALFRRGQAHHLTRDLTSARADLERARKLLPSDKAITAELAAVGAKIKAEKDKERAAYAKMFQ